MFQTLCTPTFLFEAWKAVKAKNASGGIDGISVAAFEDNLETGKVDSRTLPADRDSEKGQRETEAGTALGQGQDCTAGHQDAGRTLLRK